MFAKNATMPDDNWLSKGERRINYLIIMCIRMIGKALRGDHFAK